MTENAPTSAAVEIPKATAPQDHDLPYVGRVAVCFLLVSHSASPEKVFEDITQELRGDPRVVSIRIPPIDEPDLLVKFSISAFSEDAENDNSTPDPYSHYDTINSRFPITMNIRAPRRLQETYSAFSEIPTEEYWAAWDGITLSVIWSIENAASRTWKDLTPGDMLDALSPSGGLVVQQILKEAAEKRDYGFRTVECSPNCDYPFLHSNLVLDTVGPEHVTNFKNPEVRGLFTRVELATDHDPYMALNELQNEIQFTARTFALMRCVNDAMIGVNRFTHRNTADLLRLNYQHADASAQGLWKSLGSHWKLKGWKRQARRYLARINLSLVTLEKLRSDWARFKPLYDNSAKDGNNGVVFKSEYELCVAAMSTLQVSEVRSTVEHLTTSLDTNSLILATAIGAIVGAIVGALVGTLL